MSQYYFVGSGIASLAGAAFLIRDGHVSGNDITVFEESQELGGALDAHGNATFGYFMAGSRMFEAKYNATWDHLSFIPSTSDPTISIKQETFQAAAHDPWHANARLVNRDGSIAPARSMGFSERERIQLIELVARPESSLDGKRVTDCFDPEFFETNFWFEWCSLFAFEPWHSAIEFRRYLRRFIHRFSTIDTQEGVFRSKYNQYDSMVAPIHRWLVAKGVAFQTGTRVTNIGFADDGDATTAQAIHCEREGSAREIPVHRLDRVFITNGSMTADKSFGDMGTRAELDRTGGSGAWQLWKTLAQDRPEFGHPDVFDGHIEESSWESFTVTTQGPLFLQLMTHFSGNEPGKGGLITFKESKWLLTLSMLAQPFFEGQPEGVAVWWGYGLFPNRKGDYVNKTMAECTGAEILEEVLGHLHFTAHTSALTAASTVIPCMMPYITSQFLVREAGDRPQVVPKGSTNFAFLGQYCEHPDDVVFTVEYSVRSAQIAVDTLLRLPLRPTPMYKGLHDPRVIIEALEAMHR